MKLRDYQMETLATIDREAADGIKRQLIVLPTGGGKTIVFAEYIRDKDKKTLILAHSEDLIEQARDKYRMINEAADVGIVKAQRNELDHQVVIASIQTASRPKRLAQLKEQGFQIVVIDEAHRSAAKSYREVLEELGFFDEGTNKMVLGFTATPDRTDGKGLDSVFQKITVQYSIMTFIRAGYLCDIRGISVTTDTDISQVPTRGGDLVEYELAKAINTPERNKLVVESFQKHCTGRKALVFCANIQHADDMHAAFTDAGIEAGVVHSKVDKDDRERTMKQYAAGEIKVLINCAMLIEGYDDPPTSAILMARPTQSRILYSQAIGRGTRLFPNKKDCLVIDFCDNHHDVCALPDLFGWKKERPQDGESFLEFEARQQTEEKRRLVQKRKAQEIQILDRSRFKWHQANHLWILPVKGKIFIRIIPRDNHFMVELMQDGTSEFLNRTPLTFEFAQGIAEDYARTNAPFARKDAPWRRDRISDKQMWRLRKMGVEMDGMERLTKGEASDLIDFHQIKNALV